MILLDFYVFQAVKVVAHAASPKIKAVLFVSYWTLSAIAIIVLVLLPFINSNNLSRGFRSVVFALIIALFFAKLVAALFFLVDDIRRGFQWIIVKLQTLNAPKLNVNEGEHIPRSVFMSWLGLAFGSGVLGSLVNGFTNKYDYQVKRVTISFDTLPQAFKGLKMVHISDIHSGSFNNKEAVQKGVSRILELKPDIIFFTGDLVNNKADEMNDYIDVFSRLKAPMGVYSTLGNHDYGDYEQWESLTQKENNLNQLKEVHSRLGWRLLLDENITLEREEQKISVIGVQNISAKPRFHSYGSLAKAYAGTEAIPFKVLLSHDPSHWEGQVTKTYNDIQLMLAGHTHGMQFGVELPGFRWSPVQYVYKQWAGLYEEKNQKLYVNRGFGFIGYPGRVGILPEITLIELT
ncbi:MAG TPA: metallophosphoesterase [Chitinophagaceae bacterium]|nr:metallophosphoesterase [Chitinophagaceae bacterium]